LRRGRSSLPQPTQLYTAPVPIKTAKYKDLLKLSERHLKPEFRDFYKSLPKDTTETEDEDDFAL